MKNTTDGTRHRSYKDSSFVSRVLFWWVLPVFRKGYRNTLTLDDLPRVPQTEESVTVWKRLNRCWEEELKRSRTPSLPVAVFKAFAADFLLPGLLHIVDGSQLILQPYLVAQIVLYFGPDATISRTEALLYGVLLACTGMVLTLTKPQNYLLSGLVVLRLKAALTCAIYRKIINLNSKSWQQTDSGIITNLISTDVEKLNTIDLIKTLLLFPLEMTVLFYLLHRQLGPMFLFGIALCAMVLCLNIAVANRYGNLSKAIGYWGDRRIATMKEIIFGMKIVKMFCWEDSLTARVEKLRREETRFLAQASVLRGINFCLSSILGRLMIFAIFVGSWWLGESLPSSSVIPAIGWLEIFQYSSRLAIVCLEDVLQIFQSLYRIQKFLTLPELQSDRLQNTAQSRGKSDHQGDITITEIYASWFTADDMKCKDTGQYGNDENDEAITAGLLRSTDKTMTEFQIKNVSLRIKAGELIVLTGPVGSGKSSLLLTVLGELPLVKGEIQVCGDVGYVQQHPWVFHATLRENILMSREFDEQRYHRIIYACGLTKDIELMPHKDLTLVGERGLMLSGGQKARVSLARAIYKEVTIYLLDDPLSAVDADVAMHIFQHCICGFLKEKTRIIVTYQLQFLKFTDRIAIMEGGTITDIGTFDELEQRGTDYITSHTMAHVEQQQFTNDNTTAKMFKDSTNGESIAEEQIREGGTAMEVYMEYLKAGYGLFLFPVALLLEFTAVICVVLSDWHLIKWTKDRLRFSSPVTDGNQTGMTSSAWNISRTDLTAFDEKSLNWSNFTIDDTNQDQMYYILFLGSSWVSFLLALSLLALLMSFASRNLHRNVLPAVMMAKMRFFDSHPIDNEREFLDSLLNFAIFFRENLNRFSRDFGIIDSVLRFRLWTCFTVAVPLVVFMGTMCFTNDWMILAMIPYIVVAYVVSHIAVRTIRQFNRMEAVARSPTFSFVTDTIAGLPTIRSMKLCNDCITKFCHIQDVNSSGYFMGRTTERCYSLYVLLALWIYLTVTVFIAIFSNEGVSGDMMGLALIYLVTGAGSFQLITRYFCQLETEMTSVERVLSYTKLKTETMRTSATPPSSSWPSQGEIVLKDVNLKYYEGAPLVLKDINLTIKAMEKVGVVGRTGAGKSSLVTVLFRLAEQTGEIHIDNIDVGKIGLSELRKKISVLPQDPILFSGSLRYNMDMFDERSDEEIWEALREVTLKDTVKRLPGGLYTELSEEGNNFSVGERQLLCLARTILKHNRILILDEATANVDYRTDSIIQDTVRRKFADCTVITVAHRLQTIMDSDRIMVLEDGEVQEFDRPYRLLQEENGIFRRLVEQSGMSITALKCLEDKNIDTLNAVNRKNL